MNIEKNASYLTQRKYQLPRKNLKDNSDKIHFWNKLLGKDVLEFLYQNNPSVISFLQDTPFDIDNSSYNIPLTLNQSTTETGTKDPQQPFPAFYTPWISAAESILKSRHTGQQSNVLQNNFAELLLPKLQGISLRLSLIHI